LSLSHQPAPSGISTLSLHDALPISPAEATRAGYWACRRCHPDAAKTVDPWIDRIRRACVYLANVDGHVSLAHLAARLGGSPYHLDRKSTRLNSSHGSISYAVFCLKK